MGTVYNRIGSSASGQINITQNGNYDVKKYATASVNVTTRAKPDVRIIVGYGDQTSVNVVLIVADNLGNMIQYGESYTSGNNITFGVNGLVVTAGQGRQLWVTAPRSGNLYFDNGSLLARITTPNTQVQVLGQDWNAPHKTALYWNYD